MTIRALPGSAGYMFTGWPASAPVFEGLARPASLTLPIPSDAPPEQYLDLEGQSFEIGQPIIPANEFAPAVLAPAVGRVRQTRSVRIAGSNRPYAALEFEPTSEIDAMWSPSDDLAALATIERLEAPQLVALLDQLRVAGVWADRVACPDLQGQLRQALRRPIDTIICTMLDSDSTACLNAALGAWYGIELVAGLLLLARLTRGRAVCAMDAAVPPSWTASVRQICASRGVRIVSMINDYPQADPTLMLYSLLGRRLRPGKSPPEQGVLCLDAAAAIAIGRCAIDGSALSSVPVVVRDHGLRQSFFSFAPLGMSIGDVLSQLRTCPTATVIRCGDAARDLRSDPAAVIGGGENIIHACAAEPMVTPDPCVRCGWCIEACPTRLRPAGVLEAAQLRDIELAEQNGIDACIECGICTYVCPSRLPLLDGVRLVRHLKLTQRRDI